MISNYLAKMKKRGWSRSLTLAVTAGLLAASYSNAFAAQVAEPYDGTSEELQAYAYQVNSGNEGLWFAEGINLKSVGYSLASNGVKNTARDREVIVQKENKPLTIENLTKNTIVYYDRTGLGTEGSHYVGGDTIIKHADKGTSIVIATPRVPKAGGPWYDADGEDGFGGLLSSPNKVGYILNTLASKLTYEDAKNGIDDLDASVWISSGMTASSAAVKAGKITFDKETGKGSHMYEPVYKFSDILTGRVDEDFEYVAAKVVDENGNYIFNGKSDIDIDGKIWAVESFSIDTQNRNLNINYKNRDNAIAAIELNSSNLMGLKPVDVNIDASDININILTEGAITGILVRNDNLDTSSNLVINGDVNMFAKSLGKMGSNQSAAGIEVRNNSTMTLNGDVTIKGTDPKAPWGIINTGHSNPGISTTVGILAQRFNDDAVGGVVNINGSVDLAIKGCGIVTYGDTAEINVKGGTILVDKDYSFFEDVSGKEYAKVFALGARGGTVNMNVEDVDGKLVGSNNKVNITGNIGAIGGNSFSSGGDLAESTINLGLTTEDSTLIGVVQNNTQKDLNGDGHFDNDTNGNVNMWLQNGAVWTNKDYGNVTYGYAKLFDGSDVSKLVGASSRAKAGYILQEDSRDLTIRKYSGNMVLVYKHTNDGSSASDFAAGNTHIQSAEHGSGIVVSTDNSHIDTNDMALVEKVLNNLAGKLYYDAYVNNERNLNGRVQIASGLTGSSITKLVGGNIEFSEATGQGSYVPAPVIPEHQIQTDFKQTITGNQNLDVVYEEAGIYKENGEYVFEKNSNITIIGTKPAINAQEDIVIKAEGSNIHFVADSDQGDVNAIDNMKGKKSYEKDVTITADRVVVKANANGRADGIHMSKGDITINGVTDVTAVGTNGAVGIYAAENNATFNGNVKVVVNGNGAGWKNLGASAIYATSNMGSTKGANVVVNGMVDLSGKGNGIYANAGGATVTVNGGKIVVDKNSNDYAAIGVENGTVNMNVKLDDAGKVIGGAGNDVNITGNLTLKTSAVYETDIHGTKSAINLALDTKNSVLHGVVRNYYPEKGQTAGNLTFTGEANIWLQNGATWINEDVTNADVSSQGQFGTVIDNFVGSKDASKPGVFIQRDSKDVNWKNYSGHTLLIYAHEGDGSETSMYKAGDTYIGKAAAGSGITISTDNSNINVKDKASVEKALNALAGKLYYTDAANGKENLTGKVQIASGLTGSSASQQIGDLKFDADKNGQGSYVEGTAAPGFNDITLGDYETLMMYGARAAMVDSMVAWRDTSAESFVRANELHSGAEEGAWARINHGKVKYEGAGTEIDGNYNAVQVGFDRNLGYGWKAGLMFDYRDGNSNYKMGSTGEHELYGLGMYGTKDLGAGSYLDVVAKLGKVENDFVARNEIGQELRGQYGAEAYSLSAQYGKRFENDNGSYIEPQLQFTWAHVNSDNYDSHSGKFVMNVDQGGFDSFVGRIGLAAGSNTDRGGWYTRLSLAHEFAGDIDGIYLADDGGLKKTQFDAGDTWSELTVGGSYKMSQCSNFYADVTKTLTGDYKQDWKINAGLSFNF